MKTPASGRMRRTILWLAIGICGATSAVAQDMSATIESSSPHRTENGEMLQPEKTFAWTLTYNSDSNAILSGGNRTGAAYLQKVGLIADVDLQQFVGWRGAKLHASVNAINGRGLSTDYVGNILTVSGLEAEPALRLFNVWIEQSLDSGTSFRVGQFTAGQEFMISNTANLFVNSTFGWPASFATDLPSGGAAYPLAAPGARLAITGADGTAARIAIFAGDPAGRGSGDPQRRDLHGFNGFRLKGSPFLIGEFSHDAGLARPKVNLLIGGWIHFDRFNDVGRGPTHAGNYSIYAIADAELWSSGHRSIHCFLRASASPSDRNPIDLYADAGLTFVTPFDERPHDTLGMAIGIARLSPHLRSFVKRQLELGGFPDRVPGAEAIIELSYQLNLGTNAYLQPNAQVVIHPASWVLSAPPVSHPPRPQAFVVGLRSSLAL